MAMTCKLCGTEIKENETVCSLCGTAVENTSAPAVQETPAPAVEEAKPAPVAPATPAVEEVKPVPVAPAAPAVEESKFVCSGCGKEYPNGGKFCTECGGKINFVEPKISGYICSQCGKVYEKEQKFCTECGGKINISGGEVKKQEDKIAAPVEQKTVKTEKKVEKKIVAKTEKVVDELKELRADIARKYQEDREGLPLVSAPAIIGGGFGRSMALFSAVNFITMAIIGVIVMCIDPVGGIVTFLFMLLLGFAIPFLQLKTSKYFAKQRAGMQAVDPENPQNEQEEYLVNVIKRLSEKANLPKSPEIYICQDEELNAYATGSSPGDALVCVHSGLMERMPRRAITAVLAHEISHVANKDMMTQCLLQALANTLVVAIDFVVANSEDLRKKYGIFLWVIRLLFAKVLFLLAQLVCMAYSRHREYKADASAASMVGADAMQEALQYLIDDQCGCTIKADDPRGVFAISASVGRTDPWSTHPPLAKRIEALNKIS